MLRKLLKYEFAATARYILPLLGLLFVMGGAAALCLRLLSSGYTGRAAAVMAAIFVVLFFLSVMALAVVTLVVVVYRFYKNLLCAEGYLMHSLPVGVHTLIWSKLICALCWSVLTGLCIYGCVFAVAFRAEVWAEVLSELRALFERLSAAYGIGAFELLSVLLELAALLLLGTVSSILLFYASLAIGHSFRKNRLLISAGVFLGLGLLAQLLSMLLALVTGYSFRGFITVLGLRALAQFGHALLIGGIALSAVWCVALYLVTARMLGRHLELE